MRIRSGVKTQLVLLRKDAMLHAPEQITDSGKWTTQAPPHVGSWMP